MNENSTLTKTRFDADVVVVGAGPAGLMLACELRLAGVDVVLLERLSDIDSTIKAGAINVPTAVALDRRGLLEAAEAVQTATLEKMFGGADGAKQLMSVPRHMGHFAGIWFTGEEIDDTDPDFAGLGPAGEVRMVMQAQLEEILSERAARLGVDLRRGVGFEGCDADADGVTVTTSDGELRAAWLVGADGGRSPVRKAAGFDFPGTDGEITGHQMVVDMDGSEGLRRGWNTTDTGVYVFGPFPGRVLTVEFGVPSLDRDAPITVDEVQASIRNVTGVDVTVTKIHSATRFTDNARQASTYRKGRVLLAGDAAHVHSPFGGQGLNLSFGDAMNLGWKLAATVQGWAPEGLLDTYTTERHPIGAWVLDWNRAQVSIMRPDRHARAMRAVMADLLETADGSTYVSKKISGIWQGYDMGGGHPLVGDSADNLKLADGSALNDHLREGRGLLLDLSEDAEIRAAARGYDGRVTTVVASTKEAPAAALLVRPDGYIAWAGDTAEGLDKALAAWFGSPA
ncbi:MAG TPA: FAD-dependent monooxygenase [Stackebrandtia sp.]|jgi:2-polyprenyl-6-methoxyphenol hydroxylase-like FAD-dependent oxidoreductase|uniref:FAD-dependent monooxygenase n=1 Tax=Stackebrandtia sp. TaxID=2023065 RepID=UPI002D6BA348|nr:FAD-dependent monooxygenase [Stackebrandtia sp.]HZE38293.1 FAD-dependent monooxygenase [Stackebrandtia sp.]